MFFKKWFTLFLSFSIIPSLLFAMPPSHNENSGTEMSGNNEINDVDTLFDLLSLRDPSIQSTLQSNLPLQTRDSVTSLIHAEVNHRVAELDALILSETTPSVELLFNALQDPSPEVRMAAVRVAVDRPDIPDAHQIIEASLSDTSSIVRMTAAQQISDITDVTLASYLRWLASMNSD